MKDVKIKLRPYQEEFVNNLSVALRDYRRVIACAPTGSGKTKMFIDIARRSLENGRTVIIISESVKIYDQIINEAGGIEIARGVKHVSIKNGKLYIAMAQTLSRRPLILHQIKTLDYPPLIIVDEAHIGTPTNLLKKIIDFDKEKDQAKNEGNPYLLGFTATPDGRIAKHLQNLYNTCVVCCQVDDLINQGFLCSYKHFARTQATLDILEIRNGEYSEKSQKNAFDTSAVYDGLIDDLRRVKFNKAMIFVASIELADKMNSTLLAHGFNSVAYHSKLENADYELAKFTKLDEANICVSVASLTKGFDYPPVDLVILMRATTSLGLYLQMLGRGSRPVWGDNGQKVKSEFTVIDYGDNWKNHGLYFEDRDWTEMWIPPKRRGKKGEGVAPVSSCDKCEAIIPASVRICPYCEYERPLTEKELQQGEFKEITESYSEIVNRRISELTPEQLSIYVKMKNKASYGARVARAMEQRHKNGYLLRYQNAMGYRPGWIDFQRNMIGNKVIDFLDLEVR